MERSNTEVLSSVDIKRNNVTVLRTVNPLTNEPTYVVRELHGVDGVEYRKEFGDYTKAMDYFHSLIEGQLYG